MQGTKWLQRSGRHALWAIPVGLASLFVLTPLGGRLLRWLGRDDGTRYMRYRREGPLEDHDVFHLARGVAQNSWIADDAAKPEDIAQLTWMRWARHPDYATLPPYKQRAIVKRIAENVIHDVNRKLSGTRGTATEDGEPRSGRQFDPLTDDDILPSTQEDALETVLGEERLALFQTDMENVSERLGDTPEGKTWRALCNSEGDISAAAQALGLSKKTVSNTLSRIRAQKETLLSPEVMAVLR